MQFVAESLERPERTEKGIERQKPYTFAVDLVKTKVQTSDGKDLGACFMRDLFNILLYLSLKRQIHMNEVSS